LANEYVFFRGKVKWFRPEQLNDWGKWSHVIYPDNESLEKIRELQAEGVKNVLKKDDDGYFISIGRASSLNRRTPGAGVKIVALTPPEVIDKDGHPVRGVAVGNGSDVTTKVEVYSHGTPGGGKAKAMRWVSSRIDNLVPYEPVKDDFPHEVKAKEGFEKERSAAEDMF